MIKLRQGSVLNKINQVNRFIKIFDSKFSTKSVLEQTTDTVESNPVAVVARPDIGYLPDKNVTAKLTANNGSTFPNVGLFTVKDFSNVTDFKNHTGIGLYFKYIVNCVENEYTLFFGPDGLKLALENIFANHYQLVLKKNGKSFILASMNIVSNAMYEVYLDINSAGISLTHSIPDYDDTNGVAINRPFNGYLSDTKVSIDHTLITNTIGGFNAGPLSDSAQGINGIIDTVVLSGVGMSIVTFEYYAGNVYFDFSFYSSDFDSSFNTSDFVKSNGDYSMTLTPNHSAENWQSRRF